MEEELTTYECVYHKVINSGVKRQQFSEQIHATLMEIPMGLSMRLYKEVVIGCDCQHNYRAFDLIMKDAKIQASLKDQTQK
jgi:hypothetical protein